MKILPTASKGAALIEYGILLGLIAVVAISSVSILGGQVSGVFGRSTAALEGATQVAATAPESSSTPVFMQGATSTELHFTSIAGTPNDITFGYGNASSGSYGSLTYSAPSTQSVTQFFYNSNTGSLGLYLAGDQRSVVTGKSFQCRGTAAHPVADASLSYSATSDTTFLVWNPTDEVIALNDEDECALFQ